MKEYEGCYVALPTALAVLNAPKAEQAAPKVIAIILLVCQSQEISDTNH
jgi:hypothetical protein